MSALNIRLRLAKLLNASAAIALSKLAALTASRAVVTDGSGVITISSVTSTELGYLSRPAAGKAVSLFGDFSKATAATFGAVEIKRDDLTKLATGQTILNLEMFADTVVRQPASIVKWANVTV